jgi:hypothetical protein
MLSQVPGRSRISAFRTWSTSTKRYFPNLRHTWLRSRAGPPSHIEEEPERRARLISTTAGVAIALTARNEIVAVGLATSGLTTTSYPWACWSFLISRTSAFKTSGMSVIAESNSSVVHSWRFFLPLAILLASPSLTIWKAATKLMVAPNRRVLPVNLEIG